MTANTAPAKLGNIRLTPGVRVLNMAGYYVSAFAAIMLLTFMPQAQPFILTEILKVPASQQGAIAGELGFWAELVLILTIGFAGSLSDKIGRRAVYVFGFAMVAVGTFLSPYAADVGQLTLFRILYSFGSTAVTGMLATVIADYALDEDRGKASGLQGVMNGLGAIVTVFVLLRLPNIFRNAGMPPAQAGQTAFAVVAGLALLTAIILWFTLKKGRAHTVEERRSLWQLTQEGLRAARDPGVAFAYAASFVSRGDLAIVGTFMTLWVSNYATQARGLDSTAALARAGIVVGVAQLFALLGAPVIGWLTDRLKRVDAVIVAVLVSAIGYTSTLFVDDPLGAGMFVSAALIGLGEVGGVIASGVLIAQQAPRATRGAIVGFFGLVGGLGILVATRVGGLLFDGWRPAGPFVLFGVLGALVVVWGMVIRQRVVPLAEPSQAASD
jgi:MFS family permease